MVEEALCGIIKVAEPREGLLRHQVFRGEHLSVKSLQLWEQAGLGWGLFQMPVTSSLPCAQSPS